MIFMRGCNLLKNEKEFSPHPSLSPESGDGARGLGQHETIFKESMTQDNNVEIILIPKNEGPVLER
jgi:hypothetical protein